MPLDVHLPQQEQAISALAIDIEQEVHAAGKDKSDRIGSIHNVGERGHCM